MSGWKSLRRAAILTGVAAMIVATSACATDSGSNDEPETNVRIAVYAGDTMLDITTFVAIEQGLLEAQLREVNAGYEIIEFGNGPDVVSALLGGSVDLGILPGGSIAAVNAQAGEPVLRLLTSSFEGTGLVYVGGIQHEQTDGGELSAYDGRTWGYSREGSASQILAQYVSDHHLSGWSNQTGIALGTTATMVPALSRGQVDIMVTDPAGAAALVNNDAGYIVYNPAESDRYFPYSRICNGITSTSKFVEDHPDIARAIIRSQSEAIALLKAQPDVAATLSLTPSSFQETNADSFAIAWQLHEPSIAHTDGSLSAECLADTLGFADYLGIPNVDASAFEPLG
ncbi:MAG: ABC transporter substrate-binding protein [Leucobacter sp.]